MACLAVAVAVAALQRLRQWLHWPLRMQLQQPLPPTPAQPRGMRAGLQQSCARQARCPQLRLQQWLLQWQPLAPSSSSSSWQAALLLPGAGSAAAAPQRPSASSLRAAAEALQSGRSRLRWQAQAVPMLLPSPATSLWPRRSLTTCHSSPSSLSLSPSCPSQRSRALLPPLWPAAAALALGSRLPPLLAPTLPRLQRRRAMRWPESRSRAWLGGAGGLQRA